MYYIKQNEIIKIEDGLNNVAVLAPCMYWFVKKSFPFDGKRKIEKIILKSAKNSVDFVESVFSYKQDDEHICFAYNLNALKKRFVQEGMHIDKIYFISSFYAPELDIRVNKEIMLQALAQTYFENSGKSPREVGIRELSFEGVECVTFVKNDYFSFHVASLALLGVGFLLSIVSWSMEGNRLDALEQTITQDNYTMDALIRKYESVHEEQTKLRSSLVAMPTFNQLRCKGVVCESK